MACLEDVLDFLICERPAGFSAEADQLAHLVAHGLHTSRGVEWPELIREVSEFPRTPSGKIQKFMLRQRLREEAAL